MKKIDIIASLIIGVVSGLIAFLILDFIEWEFLLDFIGWELPLLGDSPLVLLVVLPVGAVGMIFMAQILAKKTPVILQVAKCFLTGVLNTFIDLGVLNFLMGFLGIFSGWFYSVFKAISFSIATVNSYFWNKYWTFEKKETKPGAGEFGKLYIISGIGLFLNVGIASLLVKVGGSQFGLSEKIWANISAGIATFIVFGWNFFGYKFLVFKK